MPVAVGELRFLLPLGPSTSLPSCQLYVHEEVEHEQVLSATGRKTHAVAIRSGGGGAKQLSSEGTNGFLLQSTQDKRRMVLGSGSATPFTEKSAEKRTLSEGHTTGLEPLGQEGVCKL
jgi:hypothetical protein